MGDLHEVLSFRHFPDTMPRLTCCSATRLYASQALPLAGVPIPDDFITADDVSAGKPDPEPYLKGAAALGLDPSECTLHFNGLSIRISLLSAC